MQAAKHCRRLNGDSNAPCVKNYEIFLTQSVKNMSDFYKLAGLRLLNRHIPTII